MAKFKYVGKLDATEGNLRAYEGKCFSADGVVELESDTFINKARKNPDYSEVEIKKAKSKKVESKKAEPNNDAAEDGDHGETIADA